MRQHTRFDKGMLFFNLDDAEKTANINSNPKHTLSKHAVQNAGK